jgi:hypothetical protein
VRHHNNASPYGVHVDAETGTSIIFDRLFRPLVSIPGKWPRVNYSAAVACDPEPKMYGVANSYFYRPDDVNAPRCCPVVRKRLAELVRSIPALQEEIQRRTKAADIATTTFNSQTESK